MEKYFEVIPNLGFYHQRCTKFTDNSLFEEHKNYIKLEKVKLWYGSVSQKIKEDEKENISGRCILGIQCEYQNTISGEKKQTQMHCGSLTSNDISTSELELKEGDYISKFYICFNDVITYLKFITKKGKILEYGVFDKDCEKTISFNFDESVHMIHSFFGYYNEYGLRALGCNHLKRKNYFFFNLIDVFRYRYKLSQDQKEKDKWDEKAISQLGYYEKAFLKLCLLPKAVFFSVIKYCC
jgi:hypothetical protein